MRSHYERSLTSVRQLLLYTYLITGALIFRVVFTLFRLPCSELRLGNPIPPSASYAQSELRGNPTEQHTTME